MHNDTWSISDETSQFDTITSQTLYSVDKLLIVSKINKQKNNIEHWNVITFTTMVHVAEAEW